jgi:adenylate cyclase
MDSIWQWAWDRYGASYTWALCMVGFLVSLPIYLLLFAFPIVALEKSDHYVEVVAVTVAAVMVLECIMVVPNHRLIGLVEQWAAGLEVDRATALEGTYSYARAATTRTVWGTGVWAAVLCVVVGAIAGATWSRLIQYGILGAVLGIAVQLIAFHSILESALRPARVALTGDTAIGDSLPRSRPTFAARSNVSVVAVAFAFAVGGALLAAVFNTVGDLPILAVAIGGAVTVAFAVPISVGIGFSQSLRPIRDLAQGSRTCCGR